MDYISVYVHVRGFQSLKSQQLIYPILGSSRNELSLHVAVVYFVALINCPFLVG